MGMTNEELIKKQNELLHCIDALYEKTKLSGKNKSINHNKIK